MEEILLNCYRSPELAAETDCGSVAFGAIGTGRLRYPCVEAANAAVDNLRKFLDGRTGAALNESSPVTLSRRT